MSDDVAELVPMDDGSGFPLPDRRAAGSAAGEPRDQAGDYVDYVERRRRLHGSFFETALPNEYLVEIGRRDLAFQLGGRRLRLFRKFIRVPASVQTLRFSTDNANQDWQGIGVAGYATWRIDPARPEVAFRVLDFFDVNDPMARTNSGLRTICVEAVRHVLANMSLDDALRKKAEIAAKLRSQLEDVERKWGIVFDQVGIEQVRVMSSRLFEQLQSRFRDELRLEVERARIGTDREIARESNAVREANGLERIGTDERLERATVERSARVEEAGLEERHRVDARRRGLEAESLRESLRFDEEKARGEAALAEVGNALRLGTARSEAALLEARVAVARLQAAVEAERLGTERLERELGQSWTREGLVAELLARLPETLGAVKIDSYNVLSGADGGSPVSRLLMEVAAALKTVDLGSLLGGADAGGAKKA